MLRPPSPKLPDKIIEYELGELGHEETIWLFQELIDTGLAWQLQGHYGRTAKNMLDAGLCCPAPDRRD